MPKVRNEDMSAKEFLYRIGGLQENTPLVGMIRIRKEKDVNVIKKWPQELQAINAQWVSKRNTIIQNSSEFGDYKLRKNRELAKFFFDAASEENKQEILRRRDKRK